MSITAYANAGRNVALTTQSPTSDSERGSHHQQQLEPATTEVRIVSYAWYIIKAALQQLVEPLGASTSLAMQCSVA